MPTNTGMLSMLVVPNALIALSMQLVVKLMTLASCQFVDAKVATLLTLSTTFATHVLQLSTMIPCLLSALPVPLDLLAVNMQTAF